VQVWLIGAGILTQTPVICVLFATPDAASGLPMAHGKLQATIAVHAELPENEAATTEPLPAVSLTVNEAVQGTLSPLYEALVKPVTTLSGGLFKLPAVLTQ